MHDWQLQPEARWCPSQALQLPGTGSGRAALMSEMTWVRQPLCQAALVKFGALRAHGTGRAV